MTKRTLWNHYVERTAYVDYIMMNLPEEDIEILQNGCGSAEIGAQLTAWGIPNINLPRSVAARLLPACIRHDIAYVCGDITELAPTSRYCDDLRFYADCLFLAGWNLRCHFYAIVAYRAIRRLGGYVYEARKERYGIEDLRRIAHGLRGVRGGNGRS